MRSGVRPNPSLKNLRPPDPKEDDQRRCGVRLRVNPRPLLQDELNNGKSVQEKGLAFTLVLLVLKRF